MTAKSELWEPFRWLVALSALLIPVCVAAQTLGPVPGYATLALTEDWSAGTIDAATWYSPHKKWGQGNNGVTPENVRLARDIVAGHEQDVLVLEAHGDQWFLSQPR